MLEYDIKNLTFQYPSSEKPTLNNITLQISKGDFVLIIGPSGSGKSTFLKQLKTILAPHGSKSGDILFEDIKLEKIDASLQSQKIGFVSQDPDNQIVTDKVWHELAFGLENLGCSNEEIRLKVAETASFFGIQNWFHKDVKELSGGQKQILNLASILTMNPSVLILDEPTSQLDPIASKNFFEMLHKINTEFGITIILSEHRLEEVFQIANKFVLIDKGKVKIEKDNAQDFSDKVFVSKHKTLHSLPTPTKLFFSLEDNYNSKDIPITVKDGKTWFTKYSKDKNLKDVISKGKISPNKEIAISLKNIYFRYDTDDIIKDLSFDIEKSSIFTIMGGNGTGKSTTLSIMCGLKTPYNGNVFVFGKNMDDIELKDRYSNLIAYLPQKPQTLFTEKKVIDELWSVFKNKLSDNSNEKINEVIKICGIKELLNSHPYDLSGGEMQKVGLAKILLLNPKILLLDEPTKGLDGYSKIQLAKILKKLKQKSVTIIMVSHDIEFSAKYSDKVSLFFDGSIVSIANSNDFFAKNNFYTTSVNRIARDTNPKFVTRYDILKALDKNCNIMSHILDANNIDKNNIPKIKKVTKVKKTNKNIENQNKKELTSTNKTNSKKSVIVQSVMMLFLYFLSMKVFDYKKYILQGMALIPFFSIISMLSPKDTIDLKDYTNKNNSLNKRTLLASIMVLILIPLTILFGVYFLNDRKYYFISLLIILEVFIPFALVFENRKAQAKELVIIAVLIAIAVVGRSAFFMLPQFKPVAAIVIITGISLGAEAGFLTGSMTMLISNMMFGQGTWTPWQMFALGLIGFLSGILSKTNIINKNRKILCIYGMIVVIVIYGGIMNPASVISFQSKPTFEMFLLSYINGFPMDLIFALSTSVFLWFLSHPMLEKLERTKIKYGIMQ